MNSDVMEFLRRISIGDTMVLIIAVTFMWNKLSQGITAINKIHDEQQEEKKFKDEFVKLTKEVKLLRQGEIEMLKLRLIREMTRAIERGSISISELESIKGIEEVYIKLGGNGTVKKMWEDIQRLPIKGEKYEQNN